MPEFLAQHWPFLAFLAVLVLLGMIAWRWTGGQKFPYERRPSLLTATELNFYRTLREAVEDDWSICVMVRMADLIRVRPKTTKPQGWFNRIRSKHIDFVLCEKDSLEVVVAIELDDASHQRPERIERDEFVDAAMEAAGVPLIRFPVKMSYDPDDVRATIDETWA